MTWGVFFKKKVTIRMNFFGRGCTNILAKELTSFKRPAIVNTNGTFGSVIPSAEGRTPTVID